jgi:hypothetical protein
LVRRAPLSETSDDNDISELSVPPFVLLKRDPRKRDADHKASILRHNLFLKKRAVVEDSRDSLQGRVGE